MPEALRISWSQLRSHTECHQKSHLLRTGHRNPVQNIRNFFHGTVVDLAMRSWLADPDREHHPMAATIDEIIDAQLTQTRLQGEGIVRWKHATDRAELRAFCVELANRLEPHLRELVLPYQFTCAHRFAVPVTIPYLDNTPTTITLVGEMDLLVHETPTRHAVWDLKGTADRHYWRKVVGQLIFYDLATLASFGQPTSRVGFIQPMCPTQVIPFTIGNDDRTTMWSLIVAFARDIWRGETACTTDTSRCGLCAVSHACVRFLPSGHRVNL